MFMTRGRHDHQRRRKKYHNLVGRLCEYYAAVILFFKGYRLVKNRYKCASGEIDLVVKNSKCIVFVEVKYRKCQEDALYSITPKNQRRVRRATEHYLNVMTQRLSSGRESGDSRAIRFDVVVISPYLRFKHIKNAF